MTDRELTAGPPDYWCHICNRGAEGCLHTIAEEFDAAGAHGSSRIASAIRDQERESASTGGDRG